MIRGNPLIDLMVIEQPLQHKAILTQAHVIFAVQDEWLWVLAITQNVLGRYFQVGNLDSIAY